MTMGLSVLKAGGELTDQVAEIIYSLPDVRRVRRLVQGVPGRYRPLRGAHGAARELR